LKVRPKVDFLFGRRGDIFSSQDVAGRSCAHRVVSTSRYILIYCDEIIKTNFYNGPTKRTTMFAKHTTSQVNLYNIFFYSSFLGITYRTPWIFRKNWTYQNALLFCSM